MPVARHDVMHRENDVASLIVGDGSAFLPTMNGNCGHFSYQDKASEFADMVIAWVNGGYQTL
jgi:hypothetical protein